MIDLRSDTLTKPTPAMLEAMFSAEVGDDVFGEDPTVNLLEEKCARMFGMGAALFCPSGTMTNQIGVNILTNPYEEVICYEGAHIYKYEGGGVAGNSGLSFRLLAGDRGRLNSKEIIENINPYDVHFPKTSLVAIENTVNKGGGAYYSLSQIEEIAKMANSNGLKLHLDGARLFNALVENGDKPVDYGRYFDTISICMSKGLGAPVGSVLIMKEDSDKARRIRKVFGGGMRQAGFLAAAAIFALDNNIERLKKDHIRAREIGNALKGLSYVEEVLPVDTNIVIFRLAGDRTSAEYIAILEEKGIGAVPFGPKEIRFVTHLDFDDIALDQTVSIIESLY